MSIIAGRKFFVRIRVDAIGARTQPLHHSVEEIHRLGKKLSIFSEELVLQLKDVLHPADGLLSQFGMTRYHLQPLCMHSIP